MDEMSPDLVRGVIMAEDARFCLHWGVDLRQMRLVVKEAMRRGRPARRQHDHHAGGEEPLSLAGAKLPAQGDRGPAGRMDGPGAVEGPHPGDLPQHRAVQRLGVRCGGGGASRHSTRARTSSPPRKPWRSPPCYRRRRRATLHGPSQRQRGVIAHVKRELDRAPWVFTCLDAPFPPVRAVASLRASLYWLRFWR